MTKKQKQLLLATKKELRKQALLAIALYHAGGFGLAYYNPTLYWWGVALYAFLGGSFFLQARRAVTFCVWRAFGLVVDFHLLGGVVIYILSKKMGLDFTVSFTACFLIAMAGALVIHFIRTIPYWQDTYELNLARKKFDLERGLFSVTTRWAIRGSISTASSALLPTTVIAGPLLAAMFRGTGHIEVYVMLGVATLMFWAGLYNGLIELHYIYKIRQIEKQIGRTLIIDAFAHEYNR